MAIAIPFPLPSTGYALNSQMRVNFDFVVSKFNEFNTGSASWDSVVIGTQNSLTGSLSFYNASNSYYLKFQPGTTASGNQTYTLPVALPSYSDAFLKSTTAGVTSWSTVRDFAGAITGNRALYVDGLGVLGEIDPGSGNKLMANSSPPSFATIAGTSNQITATWTAGPTLTFSTPQDIGTSSNVTFNRVIASGGDVTNPSFQVGTGTGLIGTGTSLSLVVAGDQQGSIDNAGGLVMDGEVRGATIYGTTSLKVKSGVGTSAITIQSQTGSDWTLTLPADDGTDGYVLKTNGSGVTSWVSVSGAGGATTALDNLASVAINTSLISDSDNTDDLGDATHDWRNLYLQGAIYSGATELATATELGYLDGVSSNIQTQINAKAPSASPTFSGTVTTPLTASRAVVTGGSSELAASATTSTEIGYVSGVTSAIQTQLNAKAADSAVVHNTGTENIGGSKTFTSEVTISRSANDANTYLYVTNQNTNSAAGARVYVEVGATTSSDPTIQFAVGGGGTMTVGVDNSDSDKFKVSSGTALGTNDLIIGSTAGVSIKGTNTNDSPAAGYVGEVIQSVITTSTDFPTSGTIGDLTSISLTAGDWIISVDMWVDTNGATVTTTQAGTSTTSGNSGSGWTQGDNRFYGCTNGVQSSSISMANYHVQLSGTTTYYLKYAANYSVATPQARGRITAVRIR